MKRNSTWGQPTMIESSDTTRPRPTTGRPVHDLVGVGFGPANLALAAYIHEEHEEGRMPPLGSVFLERREGFDWHPDMLIEGTRIQLSFLKDLVTLRNPRSRFSFLCYLAERERLVDFVNLREFFPTRIEFNDYYRWVAEQVAGQVRFDRSVTAIEPVPGPDGGIELLRITATTGDGVEETRLARNLVLAPGGSPFVPKGVELDSERVFHCRDFLGAVESRFPDRDAPYRFVVVGSGQSAAEIFQYLYTTYPSARVTATLRRYAYKPADESHFVNEIFNPGTVDVLYELPGEVRSRVIDDHYDTNYSAVDLGLIREIYSTLYERRVQGQNGVEVRNLLELIEVERGGDGVLARYRDLSSDRIETLEADGMVLATGYTRNPRPKLLEPLEPYLEASSGGCWEVERDYRVRTVAGFRPKVFLQGLCESTHGLSDTLLSVLPLRAGEILGSVLDDLGTTTAAREPATAMRLAETRG
jgi:L-ornithine N5-oxygenase